jgi:hypothetical protein
MDHGEKRMGRTNFVLLQQLMICWLSKKQSESQQQNITIGSIFLALRTLDRKNRKAIMSFSMSAS